MSQTVKFLHSRDSLTLGKDLAGAPPTDPMAGIYPSALKDCLKGQEVVVIGMGELYQRMLGPAFAHLGVKVYGYDQDASTEFKFGETKLSSPNDAPPGIPAYVLVPDFAHTPEFERMIKQGRPVAMEKPICLPHEIETVTKLAQHHDKPTYFIDFNLMMGRALPALAGGVAMPFMDSVTIENDSEGKIAQSIKQRRPLVSGKIVKVTANYLQAGSMAGGTIVGKRSWLDDLGKGGGIARDLMTRLFTFSGLLGLTENKIEAVKLDVFDAKAGSYRPVAHKDEAEHRATVKGEMQNGAAFEFTVGKYAPANSLNYKVEYDTGDSITLEWLPPNRKTRVTWEKDGKPMGSVYQTIDPYLMIAIDSLHHLNSKTPVPPLYLDVQTASVAAIAKATAHGRKDLPEPIETSEKPDWRSRAASVPPSEIQKRS